MNLLLATLVAAPAFAAAPVTTGATVAGNSAPVLRSGAATCLVGAYVLSLHDLEPSKHSFGADLWLWGVCDTDVVRPLAGTEFINGRDVKYTQDTTVPRGGKYWSYRKVSATFAHDWDTRDYPFDHQVLTMIAEYTSDIVQNFVYTPDLAGTRLDPSVHPEGWRVGTLALESPVYRYATTFGDPLLGKATTSDYSRLVMTIPIQRDSVMTFLKLTVGAYAAFVVSLLSFLFDARQPTLVNARMSLVVGSLFAVLVNLRATEGVLGRAENLTLVDRIHILVLGHLLIAGLVSVLARRLTEQERVPVAQRLDRIAMAVSLGWFLIANLLLIARAQAGG